MEWNLGRATYRTARTVNRTAAAVLALVLSWLAACSGPATRPSVPFDQAARTGTAIQAPPAAEPTASFPRETGADVLRHIQARYANTQARCNNSPTAPAFVCSGILLRATRFATGGRYNWMPNPGTSSEGVSFSWLRRDSNFHNPYPSSNGFIFYPKQYADGYNATKIYVRCSYPYDAWTAGPDRCVNHDHNGAVSVTPLCHLHTPAAILAAVQWIQAGYNDDENQCAFSTVSAPGHAGTADAFIESIRVRGLLLRSLRGELVVDSWETTDPKNAPVEAFFYQVPTFDPTYQDPLANAKEDQKIYYGLTGRWVPLIRWNLNRAGDQAFAYVVADQAIPEPASPSPGEDVARHLQARFDDTAAFNCHTGVPAFVCSGILIRGTDYSPLFDSWIPNPNDAKGGVSFSWLRQDSNFPTAYKANGFIVLPRDFADAGKVDNINIRCGYIRNAGTAGRPDKCAGDCQSKGITTAQQYIAGVGNATTCGFKVEKGTADSDKAWMAVADVRNHFSLFTWNEIIAQDWTTPTHSRIPIEAFFYMHGNSVALQNAKGDQQDFKVKAGRWVPVIEWTPATSIGGRATFAYSAADQSITQ